MSQFDLSALLELLVCPACRAKVELAAAGERVRCRGCAREYPVEEGIPVMIEARASGGPRSQQAAQEP